MGEYFFDVAIKDNSLPLSTTPLITQVRTAYFSFDCGMCYVIRLSDGRFVIIDSNAGEYEESDRLWDILEQQNVLGDKPTIAAWFFSHAHVDHIGGFSRFMSKYGDNVSLQRVLYQWPEKEYVYPLSELNAVPLKEFHSYIDSIKDKVEVITPHSGERYSFGDAIFDVLITAEDLYPEFIPNFNDSSLVLMMTLADKKVLWLTDSQKQAGEFMSKKYPKEVLECDILQVGHHGYNSSCDALHRMADPEYLLWPCPDFWYPVVKYWDENVYLITSPKVKEIYISGQQQITIDLTKPMPHFEPYIAYNKGEVLYEENFGGDRVIDLNFSCITGGSTGYVPAKASLENGICTLKNDSSDNFTVCQFIQPDLIRLNPDFSLEFSGKIKGEYDKFGIMMGYSQHTVFNEEKVLWLEPLINEEFSFEIKTCYDKKNAEVFLNGEFFKNFPIEEIGGLHFVLRNAELKLDSIKIIRI